MPLPSAPADMSTTRDALHRVAELVVAARRTEATGNEIALTVRDGAVATPDLPGGGWVGLRDADLIVTAAGGGEVRHPITSLRAAGQAAGLTAWADLDDAPLTVSRESAAFLTAAFVLAADALGASRAEAPASGDPSPVLLWPEHFDIAFDEGDESAGRRAGFGFSPGDEEHPEPYAYVGPWAAPPAGPLWEATGFRGAQLDWAEIAGTDDPRERLLAFWRERREALQVG